MGTHQIDLGSDRVSKVESEDVLNVQINIIPMSNDIYTMFLKTMQIGEEK